MAKAKPKTAAKKKAPAKKKFRLSRQKRGEDHVVMVRMPDQLYGPVEEQYFKKLEKDMLNQNSYGLSSFIRDLMKVGLAELRANK